MPDDVGVEFATTVFVAPAVANTAMIAGNDLCNGDEDCGGCQTCQNGVCFGSCTTSTATATTTSS